MIGSYVCKQECTFRDRLRNKLYYIQKMFQSDGVMGPEVGGLLRKSQDLRQADEKLIRLMDDIDAKFKDFANNYTIKLPKYFQALTSNL